MDNFKQNKNNWQAQKFPNKLFLMSKKPIMVFIGQGNH